MDTLIVELSYVQDRKKRRVSIIFKTCVAMVSCLTLLSSCSRIENGKANQDSNSSPDALSEKNTDENDNLSLNGDNSRFIVVFKEQPPERVQQALKRLPGIHLSKEALAERVANFKTLKKKVLDAVAISDLDFERDYDHLPIARIKFKSQKALDKLKSNPNVEAVFPDEKVKLNTIESLPFIKQPETAALGYTGQDTAVAVLDSGVDYTRAALGSCTAPGLPSGSCRVAFARDFATEDNQLDDSVMHGTNVAGIIAGVAPSTKILALDVFDGDSAWSSVIIDAINWAIANKSTYKIAALNMSLGGAASTTPCGTKPMSIAIQNARDAGILSAVASGNEGYSDSIAYPGCAPAAVSVGAVYDKSYGTRSWGLCSDASTAADKVVCFSNSANFLTILAPGVSVTAAGVAMSGTSQATPHVAGAIAVLRAAFPDFSPDQIVNQLTSNGVSVTDSRNNITKPRLDLLASVRKNCELSINPKEIVAQQNGGLYEVQLSTGQSCEWSLAENADWIQVIGETGGVGSSMVKFQIDALTGGERSTSLTFQGVGTPVSLTIRQAGDSAAPIGSVVINDGAIYTKTQTVTLKIAASDPSGVKEMCISRESTCLNWESYKPVALYILSNVQGNSTVWVWLRDNLGNTTTTPITDSVIFDSIAPTMGTLRGSVSRTSMYLTWTPATDATSGIASYKLVYFEGYTVPNSGCTNGTSVPVTSSTSALITNLKRGTTYTMRLCAIDRAGNVSPGTAARGATTR